MKIFVHYTIWNKESMVQWFAKGIKYCIPPGSHVDFVLDNCTDSTKLIVSNLQSDPNFNLNEYVFNWYESDKKYRWQNTNDAIERFLQTDCTHFLSPQDDQKIQDSFIFQNLQMLYNSAPVKVGIIGMRDGITDGNYLSAHHSHKVTSPQRWLRSGEYHPVEYINDGPVCLSRECIEAIGLFDVNNFIAFYTDQDYSYRCKQQGFQPYVMGAEIVHEKWGNVIASELYTQEIASHDYNNFLGKYPKLRPNV
jgi:GT2 family glycosyltransferase